MFDLDDDDNGHWLVVKTKGCSSATQIDPDYAELDAALYHVREAMIQAMHKKSELRSKSGLMSEKEQRAWKAYDKIMGADKPTYFEFPSLYEIAQAGCDVIKEKAKRNIAKHRAKMVDKGHPIMDLEV